MSQIAINSKNSIFLDGNGQIAFVTNKANSYPASAQEPTNARGEATRQAILERLATWQGEDYINRLFGIPYINLFYDAININFFLVALQRNILQCFGVVNLQSFTWGFGDDALNNNATTISTDLTPDDLRDRQSRVLIIEFTVHSTDGELNFTSNFPMQGGVANGRFTVANQ